MQRKPTIYFYCNPVEPLFNHYYIALAEGFNLLGIPYYSNVNYWPQNLDCKDFLLKESPDVSIDYCDVVVLSNRWFDTADLAFPDHLFKRNRSFKTVYIDLADGYKTLSWRKEFRKFDLILKAHWNRNFSYPSNLQPMAFSLTNRIIDATKETLCWNDRSQDLLSNFRVALPLRVKAAQEFYPRLMMLFNIDQSNDNFERPCDPYNHLLWENTGGRHNPSYYSKLTSSKAISCFGGYFVNNSGDLVSRLLSKLNLRHKQILLQWDSWRLWEAWSAGCLVFHVDFEKYGLQLPIMPKNWEHYIGIDFDNLDESCRRIYTISDSDQFESIATRGRQWALTHYSPLAVAQRFLESLGFLLN